MRLIIFSVLTMCSLALQGQTTWSLIWSDEFSGNTLNTSNWNFDIGTGNWGWGNNELQYYTNSNQNLFLANGLLHIMAKQQAFGTSNYTSARINSSNKFNFTYGRLEARIKLPMGQGLWPAFWLLGQNINEVSWPECGEIDVMEHVNNNDYINGTLHWNQNGHQYNGSTTSFDPEAFHQYMIEWDENKIQWFIDGISFKTMNITSNNMSAFHQPFFVILNLAVGGLWPGSPDNTTPFPSEMLVDYVRYYQPEIVNDISEEQNTELGYYISNDKLFVPNNENLMGDYKIIDISGKTAHSGIITSNEGISLSGISTGLYFLQINSNSKNWIRKIYIP
jgi:beta-glucanase (GH16 family)